MPRLVRKAPLSERIKTYLDPSDWALWISEELSGSGWEDLAASYALYIGLGANLAFIVAQANTGASNSFDNDGVFREASGPGWLSWLANLLVLMLSAASCANAWLVYSKKRHYRLFEQPIETTPTTPSAKRVRVDSSPAGASPFSYLRNIAQRNSAAARAHPDATRDVWEIAVWDPNPLCLELFCLFSPLHVALYYLNLPVAQLDPRPSVRAVATIFIGLALSLHLSLLRSSFTQQIKDNNIISRQVLHEYDSKYVHPSLQRPSRDVGIQTISKKRNRDSSVGVKGSPHDLASEVTTYTPRTIVNKKVFLTNPNSNYKGQYDPDNLSLGHTPSRSAKRPTFTSAHSSYTSTASDARDDEDLSSPIRPSQTPNPFRRAPSIARTSGDGGSLGVYTHAASPLRKSASANYLGDTEENNRFRDQPKLSLSDRFGVASRSSTPRLEKSRDATGVTRDKRSLGTSSASQTLSKRDGSPLKRVNMSNGEARPSGYGNLGVGRRESGRY
ncbi:uncharacterized protein EKO05_0011205 [Ascochyta rabiei]|uniref:Uncharacterized protein n=1 Tax=Didymella rabiei TaxID=5454 RepID=A0A163D7K8_DIDRA|nr:uncharacterized protein EKO05_0011205 [Ascochyta rabiei]KZM22968.1 hypothetical protein ST47_g5875 [Ascochyta rabiei]UPX20999.1 hypothetical protein EKO05_0011205 [Ascochyta rabiei]